MSAYDISKNKRIISIFDNFITKFHELPEQPSYIPTRDKETDIFVPCMAMSDHYPICFIRMTAKRQRQCKGRSYNNISFQYRCYKRLDENRFLDDLAIELESLQISQTDSNIKFKNWIMEFTDVFSRNAPFK